MIFSACGGAQRSTGPRPEDLHDIAEGRAMEIVAEACAELGVTPTAGWTIDIEADKPLAVDARLESSAYGIEWVSPQDRVDYGDHLLEPIADQLQLIRGAGEDAEAQVLLLDHTKYKFDPDLHRVQAGSVGVREAEGRLHRDVVDFIRYVQGQGAL